MLAVALWGLTGCNYAPVNRSGLNQWIEQHGGLLSGPHEQRVRRVCCRVAGNVAGRAGCRIYVLNLGEMAAHAWPHGAIYVSRGLVENLNDDELAAAIAHELGHLIDGGHLHGPWSVGGTGDSHDIELRADRIGCDLLQAGGLPPHAMIRMIEKVRAEPGIDVGLRDQLFERSQTLRSLLMSIVPPPPSDGTPCFASTCTTESP